MEALKAEISSGSVQSSATSRRSTRRAFGGGGGNELFIRLYETLAQRTKDTGTADVAISIPETLVLELDVPRAFYQLVVHGDSGESELVCRTGKHLNLKSLLDSWCASATPDQCVAEYHRADAVSRYLDARALHTFLYHDRDRGTGVLQRFLPPVGGAPNAAVLLHWAPHVVFAEQRTARLPLTAARPLDEKCAVYDAPLECTRPSHPSRGVRAAAEDACRRVAAHIERYAGAPVGRLTALFKPASAHAVVLLRVYDVVLADAAPPPPPPHATLRAAGTAPPGGAPPQVMVAGTGGGGGGGGRMGPASRSSRDEGEAKRAALRRLSLIPTAFAEALARRSSSIMSQRPTHLPPLAAAAAGGGGSAPERGSALGSEWVRVGSALFSDAVYNAVAAFTATRAAASAPFVFPLPGGAGPLPHPLTRLDVCAIAATLGAVPYNPPPTSFTHSAAAAAAEGAEAASMSEVGDTTVSLLAAAAGGGDPTPTPPPPPDTPSAQYISPTLLSVLPAAPRLARVSRGDVGDGGGGAADSAAVARAMLARPAGSLAAFLWAPHADVRLRRLLLALPTWVAKARGLAEELGGGEAAEEAARLDEEPAAPVAVAASRLSVS